MFALLEHDAPDGTHWDFLIEIEGKHQLPTWRLNVCPLIAEDPVEALPIFDHPSRFLEYQGPLRPGLGVVKRLDRGDAIVSEYQSGLLRAELFGLRLRGRVEISTKRVADADLCTFTIHPNT